MHSARNLGLLAATALAALVLGATNASASPVEFVEEATGSPCDPCVIHAEGTSQLHAHTLFGPVEMAVCDESFEAEIWHEEDGTPAESVGHVYSYANNHATSDRCRLEGCPAPDDEWDLSDPEETEANRGTVDLRFCRRDEGDELVMHCEIRVELVESAPHAYHLRADPHHPVDPTICILPPTGPEVEVDGEWQTEAVPPHDQIEVVHL